MRVIVEIWLFHDCNKYTRAEVSPNCQLRPTRANDLRLENHFTSDDFGTSQGQGMGNDSIPFNRKPRYCRPSISQILADPTNYCDESQWQASLLVPTDQGCSNDNKLVPEFRETWFRDHFGSTPPRRWIKNIIDRLSHWSPILRASLWTHERHDLTTSLRTRWHW